MRIFEHGALKNIPAKAHKENEKYVWSIVDCRYDWHAWYRRGSYN
jgi:hypothetical protein